MSGTDSDIFSTSEGPASDPLPSDSFISDTSDEDLDLKPKPLVAVNNKPDMDEESAPIIKQRRPSYTNRDAVIRAIKPQPWVESEARAGITNDTPKVMNGNGKKKAKKAPIEYLSDNLSDSEEDPDIECSDEDFEEPEPKKVKAAKAAQKRKAEKQARKSTDGSSAKKAGGSKVVPFDTVVIPMGDKSQIEKLISWRISDVGAEEIMVKYKNLGYYHAEWLPRKTVEASKQGKMRVKRFMEKPTWENQWSEDEPFNPSFVKIDRLLDEGELGDQIFYLTKWCAQTYENSTWEKAELVQELDADKITEFNKRRVLSPVKESSYMSPGRRPSPKEWKKMDESPLYKNDMQLRPYQLEGLNWLMFCWYNRQNSILADEMGLGKTVQSTVFLNQLYIQERFCGPFLIVTPLSTIGNWEREIKTWTDMNVVVYHGRDTARNLIVETEFYYRDAQGHPIPDIYKFDIILTTYEMAMAGASQLRPIPWRCVVLDEAHRLKNKTSKVSEILKTYQMEHRVLLTGTPLQNSLDELWALLNFLQPERFASESGFQEEYGSLSSAADVEKLQMLLKPLMLRRMKEDVEKSIPVKEETIIEVELTTVQKKWYRSILERNFTWLKQGTKKANVPNLINTMIELRKCCIHPFLLKGAEEQIMKDNPATTAEQHLQALIQASGKMVLIDKLLVKLKAGGHKVLIFSQMTRCLDIIQDYLRGKRWGFERIDGGVRGDLRQAAIDRFSAPESETFVFLLCTRAGGVGINLTAADTCIIFDSDWNPQNDLQAQSRVHRIGQKKPVQIYRLVTRNTYEREMFDRASMKLGLDRAILQRMDAQSLGENGFEDLNASKPTSSLSKAEIEELLKKGAYGAMLDDDASNQFCDEDIDSILSRRTQVIKHDTPAPTSEKGSIFSKATFASANADNVDINDPDFWDKMAQKAKLDVVEMTPELDLIIDLPRQRRQVQRFGTAGLRGSPGGGDDNDDDYSLGRAARPAGDVKPWAQAEKTRLERAMMVHGFSRWEQMVREILPRRTPEDVRAAARAMVIYALKIVPNLEAEILNDVKAALEKETGDVFEDNNYVIPETPYNRANKRQILEYRSFLLDAPQEYHEHLEKRAKNTLARIAMMYCIRDRINPTKDTPMPRVAGAPPAPWWGPTHDLHLLIGIAKYGYQQYDKIRMDPDLCFFAETFSDIPSGDFAGDGEVLADVKDDKDQIEGDDADEVGDDGARLSTGPPGSENASGAATPSLDPLEPTGANGLHFPTPSDLGFRLRRIMTAFTKQLNAAAREETKRQQAEERTRIREEKSRAREYDFSRKEKQDFQRTLLSYGVETVPGQPNVRDWHRFKELANLKKSVDVLEDYYVKLMAACDEVIRNTEAAAMNEGLDIPAEDKDKDDAITYDRAKKLLKRIEQMRVLREEVLAHPELDERLAALKRHGRSGLPSWWAPEHDKQFLLGIAKWGLNRSDLIMEDPTSVFYSLHKEFLRSLEIRRNENLSKDELVDGKWEEKFWMREPVANRRFEALCDAVLKDPPPKSTPAAEKKSGKKSKHSSPRAYYDDSPREYSGKSVRLKLKFAGREEEPEDLDTPSTKRKRSERDDKGRKKSKLSVKERVEYTSSGDDTDEMLQAARKKTDKRKQKRRETEDFDMIPEGEEEVGMEWESRHNPTSRGSSPAGSERKKDKKKHRKLDRHRHHHKHRKSYPEGDVAGSDVEENGDELRKKKHKSKHEKHRDREDKKRKHKHRHGEDGGDGERHREKKRAKLENDFGMEQDEGMQLAEPPKTSYRSRYSTDYLNQKAMMEENAGAFMTEELGDPILSDGGNGV